MVVLRLLGGRLEQQRPVFVWLALPGGLQRGQFVRNLVHVDLCVLQRFCERRRRQLRRGVRHTYSVECLHEAVLVLRREDADEDGPAFRREVVDVGAQRGRRKKVQVSARLQDFHHRACWKEPHHLELELCWKTLEVEQGHNGICFSPGPEKISRLVCVCDKGNLLVPMERNACASKHQRERKKRMQHWRLLSSTRGPRGTKPRRCSMPLWYAVVACFASPFLDQAILP